MAICSKSTVDSYLSDLVLIGQIIVVKTNFSRIDKIEYSTVYFKQKTIWHSECRSTFRFFLGTKKIGFINLLTNFLTLIQSKRNGEGKSISIHLSSFNEELKLVGTNSDELLHTNFYIFVPTSVSHEYFNRSIPNLTLFKPRDTVTKKAKNISR